MTVEDLPGVVGQAPAAIAVYDKDLRVAVLNEAAAEPADLPKDEQIGRRPSELMPDVGPAIEEHLREVRETEQPVVAVEVAGSTPANPDVERTWLSTFYPVRNGSDEVEAVGAISQEITDSAAAAEALRWSELRFRTLIEATWSIVWTIDAQGEVHGPQPSWSGYTGQSTQQSQGRGWLNAIAQEDRARVAAAMDSGLASGRTFTFEGRLHHAPSGDLRQFEARGVPLSDEKRVLEWVICCLDVEDLRRAERERAGAFQTLESFVDMAPLGIAILDPEMRYLHINQTLADLNCARIEDHLGRSVAELLPNLMADFEPLFRRVSVDKEAVLGLERIGVNPRNPTDERVCVESWFPLPTQTDGPASVAVIVQDVTEERRVEQDSRLTLQQLRLAQLAGRSGVFDWDMATGKLNWNDELQELYGIVPGTFEGDIAGWEKRVLPEDAQRVLELITEVLARHGEECDYEFRVPKADGTVRWLYGRARFEYEPTGQSRRMIGVNIDVTDRKRAESELRRSEERFRLASEALSGLVFEWNRQTERVERSRGLYDVVGIRPEDAEPTQDWWASRYHPDDLPTRSQPYEACVARKGDVYESEYRVLHRDGTYRNVWERTRIVYDDQGEVVRMVGCTLDVTERKRAEQELLEADRRKDVFLATLAHELRNPLAPIRNAVHLLRMLGPEEPKLAWSREVIDRQVQQMARLLDDLLDVSRITRDRLELRIARIDLRDAIRDALEVSRPLIESRGHTLVVEVPEEPVPLDADQTRLAQVFGNLLNNAAKYTESDGKIRLSAVARAGFAEVRVTDSGIGIAPESLPRIFDMFSQVSSSVSKSDGGLGIGLALVKALVEMHGGTVEASSLGAGRGSEFVVRLPMASTVSGLEEREASGRAERATVRRILVVDDNRDAADSLAMMLRLGGHQVKVAYDGETALATAAVEHPHVVLLDIGLPDLHGYEVASRLLKQGKTTRPVLAALSGWGQPEDQRRSAEVGISRHFTKPIDPDELTQFLESLGGSLDS